MDKLQECAKAFEKLLDKKYHIIIGRKGKSVEIKLAFDIVDFHHLVGLHKLKNLRLSRGNREKIFKDILAGHISFSDIEQSPHFNQIKNRIEPFLDLENILDDNRLIFKYNKKSHSFSLIQAEYLLSTPYKSNEIYIFLDRKGSEGQLFCRSFFPREYKDYTIGQPTYALLYKEKITISTGEKEVQYDRLSPIQKTEKAKKIFAEVKAAVLQKPEAHNSSIGKHTKKSKEVDMEL